MSQCSRVLDVLQEGGPKTIQEIHQRAGTMRLNSRVAELRKRGHQIVCWTAKVDGKRTYVYQLLASLESATSVRGQPPDGDGVADSSGASRGLDVSSSPRWAHAAPLGLLAGGSGASGVHLPVPSSAPLREQLRLEVA